MTQDQGELYVLLERIRQREQAALGSFYDVTVGRVFALALRVCGSRELAEEVVSDVFLQVWRTVEAYRAERSTPLGWLMMIAHSRAIDAIRRESHAHQQTSLEESCELEDETATGPLETVLCAEQGSALASALEKLDGMQRQLIALAFYRGMSHQEIARHTGQPLGTVKTILRRAQAILRETLARAEIH